MSSAPMGRGSESGRGTVKSLAVTEEMRLKVKPRLTLYARFMRLKHELWTEPGGQEYAFSLAGPEEWFGNGRAYQRDAPDARHELSHARSLGRGG